MHRFISGVACLLLVLVQVQGHGRLLEPPARSSMWRFGWGTPANYDDNQMFCGGKTRQINLGGKCGICGDPWDQPPPRKTEIGGPYYKGLLVANYSSGQVIDVKVQLTANHMGYFQFRICPVPGFNTEATQECLDQHLLTLAGTQYTNYMVRREDRSVNVQLQLPRDLQCQHCVLQWRYHAGNSWGRCEDGTGAVGCGPQEEFYGCADVSVHDTARTSTATTRRPIPTSTRLASSTSRPRISTSYRTARPRTATSASTPAWTRRPRVTTRVTAAPTSGPVSPANNSGGDWVCRGVAPWDTLPGIAEWCLKNCFAKPTFCPSSHCYCTNEMLKAAKP